MLMNTASCFSPSTFKSASMYTIIHGINPLCKSHCIKIWHFRYFRHSNLAAANNSHYKTPDIYQLASSFFENIPLFTLMLTHLRCAHSLMDAEAWVMWGFFFVFFESCICHKEGKKVAAPHAWEVRASIRMWSSMWQDARGSSNWLIDNQKSVWFLFNCCLCDQQIKLWSQSVVTHLFRLRFFSYFRVFEHFVKAVADDGDGAYFTQTYVSY